MSNFNDLPISKAEEDEYHILPFATSLGNSIKAIEKPFGTTVALYGEWGTGKSSILNLTKEYLSKNKDYYLNISEFRSWWFQGEDTLAFAFLEHLHETIKSDPGIPEDGKKALLNIGKIFCQFKNGIVLATSTSPLAPAAPLVSEGMDVLAKKIHELDEEHNSINQQYKQLVDSLHKTSKKYLIIIDDIDRLSPEEIFAIFRIIRTIGQLPNIIYLLAFDKTLAINSLKKKFNDQSLTFLEKIIQNSFEVPFYSKDIYKNKIFKELESQLDEWSDEDISRAINITYDILIPYINSPRRLNIYKTAIRSIWPNIKGSVNYLDFVSLECIRLFEKPLYSKIKQNPELLCVDKSISSLNSRGTSPTDEFLSDLSLENPSAARFTLMRLFPKFEKLDMSSNEIFYWQAKQRCCLSKYFYIYFYLDSNRNPVPYSEIKLLLDSIQNSSKLEDIFLDALQIKDENGQSKIPKYINELCAHSYEIHNDQKIPLLKTIFKLYDKINIVSDEEYQFLRHSDNSTKILTLINRLFIGLEITERTRILKDSINPGSLGIKVSLSSKIHNINKLIKEKKISSENILAGSDSESFFNKQALNEINRLKDTTSFIEHPDLIFILYQWNFLTKNNGTVKNWCDSIIKDDHNILLLMKAFTGTSIKTHSSFAEILPDRECKPDKHINITNNISFLDVATFRTRLEQLKDDSKLSIETKEAIINFLEKWDEQIKEEYHIVQAPKI